MSEGDDNARDPNGSELSWLERLSAADWLAAASNELGHAQRALEARAYRSGVTHARRAAGMACNAVLRVEPHEGWGRSYMDHVVALSHETELPEAVVHAGRLLVETKPAPPELVPLGKPDLTVLRAAEAVIAWAQQCVARALEGTSFN